VNPISIIDCVSLMTVLVGLIIFLTRGRAFRSDVRFLFIGLLALTLFRNFSNVLEWSGITAIVGLYEEFVEILTPLLWVFFLYAFLRQKDEEALRESEEQYRLLFENVNDVIYSIDRDFRLTSVSPSVEAVLGYRPDELIGKRINELNILAPEYIDLAFSNTKIILAGERNSQTEYEFIAKDGTRKIAEISAAPLVKDGKIVAGTDIARDITERKRAEEALAESEERYRTLIEDSVTGICLIQDEKLRFVNRRLIEILDYTQEELLGMSFLNFVHPDERELAREIAARRTSGQTPTGHPHFRLLSKDGGVRWMELFGTLLEYQGKPAVLLNLIDITERKRAEEERQKLEAQVQHAQKLESLGVLAGGIAHDFNNLLTSILGHADLALLKLPSASPARDNLKEIETASRRAAELCNQMLAYSGKGKFIVEPTSLNEVIEEMAHLLEISISKNAVLKFNFAENLPAVEADATQMRQVVMNLITNASEAIGERSGVISISTGAMECGRAYLAETYLNEQLQEGAYVYLEVSDSGDGMDEETTSKIFDPFFTTKFTGRGLGLAAVQGIVRGHGGAIKIYSELGKGTTFKILFPAASHPAEEMKREAAEIENWRGSGTVLVVDDEETVRTVAKRMLQTAGFDVLTTTDGREAVEVFREHADEITLVLLDMTMPYMSGEETFREIRRIKSDAPVILSSGYKEQEVTNHFAGKGLAGFIQKPYQYKTLVEKIRSILGG